MKVILLSPLPPPSGGIAGWTQRMLTANLKDGWTVGVVDEKLIGDRSEKVVGKRSMLTEFVRSHRIWKELKRQLKDAEAKVVQACIPASVGAMLREIVSAKITHSRRRKFITHFRCTVPNMIKSKTQMNLLEILVKNSDCIFCLNQQTIDFIKSFNRSVDCRYIPNFVDISETYQRLEHNEKIKKAVYTGRILESKGCKLIVDVAIRCPEIQFELIGKVLMDAENIPPNVVLTGEKDKDFIRQELKSADVFLFLTKFSGEGFSNSLAEAMAYSLPCIVTDWAANKDMIGNEGGVVLEEPSIDDVVNAINSIKSADIRTQMGKYNYRKVLTQFSQEIVTAQYVNVYSEIIQKKHED